MAPPPATPTPHRFLVPRRSQPRGETPSSSFHPGGQQFRATPRFSLSSTPRPPPSSASLTPFRNRGSGRDIPIDSSPPPLSREYHGAHEDDHGSGGGNNDSHDRHYTGVDEEHRQDIISYEHDSVIDEDDIVQGSSPIRGVGIHSEDLAGGEERQAKRRRISVSPTDLETGEAPSPTTERGRRLDVEMSGAESTSPRPPSSDGDINLGQEDLTDELGGDDKNPFEQWERKTPQVHQPVFQRAPRFKPAEISEGASHLEPLPDAFSPRRKGARYAAGGLAAELRDWLVDVEAGIGSSSMMGSAAKRDESWAARIRVDNIRSANEGTRAMTLVTGRQILDGKSHNSSHRPEPSVTTETLGTNTIHLILAGSGRLTGLGVSNEVKPGVILGIGRPTWEVALDGLGRWQVACDWTVLS